MVRDKEWVTKLDNKVPVQWAKEPQQVTKVCLKDALVLQVEPEVPKTPAPKEPVLVKVPAQMPVQLHQEQLAAFPLDLVPLATRPSPIHSKFSEESDSPSEPKSSIKYSQRHFTWSDGETIRQVKSIKHETNHFCSNC